MFLYKKIIIAQKRIHNLYGSITVAMIVYEVVCYVIVDSNGSL